MKINKRKKGLGKVCTFVNDITYRRELGESGPWRPLPSNGILIVFTKINYGLFFNTSEL